MPDELAGWIALSLVSGLGDEHLRRLLTAFGSPEEILAAPTHELARIVSAPVAAAIAHGVNEAEVRPALDWAKGEGCHIVTLADVDYPKSLLQIADPPPLLYVMGRRDLLNAGALAMVGSRNASAQGVSNAEVFAESLSHAGLTIVSGLALGIDAAAHRGGLKGAGSSIAVVGTGLDIVYPRANRDLAHQLAATGLIVSEFALGTPPLGANFPRRNRIISGLARGCLVVEATLSSGSLITARLAAEQGREVFAIPGSIHSPFSKGCHKLIKQGAKLVESAHDVLEELRWESAARANTPPTEPGNPPIDAAHPSLLDHMGFDPVSFDQLAARAQLPADMLNAQLLQLELDGAIARLPGALFQRMR